VLFAQHRSDPPMPGQPVQLSRSDQGPPSSAGTTPNRDRLETQAPEAPLLARVSRCPLSPELRTSIADAITSRRYHDAEVDLVNAINQNPSSPDLLVIAAGVFFLDREFLNTAIALKKADHIRPLQKEDRLTLCLAYIALHRGEWARPELEKLMRDDPDNAIFPYWLARIDYDERRYADAISRFKQSVKLDPNFAKGYDNLGLSLEANGELEGAMAAYEKAAQLNRQSSSPSPWPPVNFGALLLRTGREKEAEAPLLEALKYDSNNVEAHYRLGLTYDKQGRAEQAIAELRKASELDPAFADPFYALGRIYRSLGDQPHAEQAFNSYRTVKDAQREQLTPPPASR
jgi:tetratricopeptide (TPR) repeat protein